MPSTFFTFAVVCCALANSVLSYPLDDSEVYIQQLYDEDMAEEQPTLQIRNVRSLQPGAPNFPAPGQNNGGWQVDPSLSRDQNGNTQGNINVQHSGPNHQVNAEWGKVIRGPGRAKPTWSIHGTYKW